MKTTKPIIILLIICISSISEIISQNCVQCDNTLPPPGNLASEIGINTTASSDGAFAGGYNSIASGFFSFAFGNQVTAEGASSLAIGRFLHSSTSPAMIFGCGVDNANRLVNSIPYSLMIGFNSNKSTLFVGKSPSIDSTGRIGIGNITQPLAKLHIRADATENATLRLEATGTGKISRLLFSDEHHISASNSNNMVLRTPATKNFVFENGNVGIGTSAPVEKLQIVGFAQTSGGYKVNTSTVINAALDISGRNGTFSGQINVKGTGNSSFSGNVGIGTTSPAEKLQIAGFAQTSSGYKVNSSIVVNQNLDFSGRIGLFTGNVTVGTSSLPSVLMVQGKTITRTLQIFDPNPQNPPAVIKDYVLKSADNEGNVVWVPQSVIDDGDWIKDENNLYRFGGNVGIGCSAPQAQFQVGSSGSSVGMGKLDYSPDNLGFALGYYGINVKYIGSSFVCDHNNYDNGGALIYSTIGGNLHFITIPSTGNSVQNLSNNQIAENRRLTITSDGKIGIGVTNPPDGYKLSVAGKIRAEELTIELVNDWYDHVFSDDYQLPTITELDGFIRQNKHLPDLPPEQEICDKGFSVGEMNGLLLKKVEELTLYLIQQNQELTKQRNEINLLKQRVGN